MEITRRLHWLEALIVIVIESRSMASIFHKGTRSPSRDLRKMVLGLGARGRKGNKTLRLRGEIVWRERIGQSGGYAVVETMSALPVSHCAPLSEVPSEVIGSLVPRCE